MIKALFVSLSLISAALAQSNSTNNTAVGIEAIQAHFSNAGLVPSLLATFDPSALMTVDYSGVGDIQPGQALSQSRKSRAERVACVVLTMPLSAQRLARRQASPSRPRTHLSNSAPTSLTFSIILDSTGNASLVLKFSKLAVWTLSTTSISLHTTSPGTSSTTA